MCVNLSVVCFILIIDEAWDTSQDTFMHSGLFTGRSRLKRGMAVETINVRFFFLPGLLTSDLADVGNGTYHSRGAGQVPVYGATSTI
jgi:hypothetical protein